MHITFLRMLDSGLEGAIFAVFTGVIGPVQAYLSQNQRATHMTLPRPSATIQQFFGPLFVYFCFHLLTTIALLCAWRMVPSHSTSRHLIFRVLLECSWLNGSSIQVSFELYCGIRLLISIQSSAFLNHLWTSPPTRALFHYIAALTSVVHIVGFIILQNKGKTLLFAAGFMVTFSLSAVFIIVTRCDWSRSTGSVLIRLGTVLVVLIYLSFVAIDDVDKFLQVSSEFRIATKLNEIGKRYSEQHNKSSAGWSTGVEICVLD